MCAMMPMFLSLARAASAAATSVTYFVSSSRPARPVLSGQCWLPAARYSAARLPAVMCEGLVGLGHLVGVLAPLHGGTEAVARVEQLVLEPLDHCLLTPCPGVL